MDGSCLVVDEIGQTSSHALNLIESIFKKLRAIKVGKEMMFGGVRLIVVGDPLQLPPMGESYFFEADCFIRGKFYCMYLNQPYRQDENGVFCQLMLKVRDGFELLKEKDILLLNSLFKNTYVTKNDLQKTYEMVHSFYSEELKFKKISDYMYPRDRINNMITDYCSASNQFSRYLNSIKFNDLNSCYQLFIITPVKEERDYFNVDDSGEVVYAIDHVNKRYKQLCLNKGSRVIITDNRVAGLFNNQLVQVEIINDDEIVVRAFSPLTGNLNDALVTVGRLEYLVKENGNIHKKFPFREGISTNLHTVQGLTLNIPTVFSNGRISQNAKYGISYGATYMLLSRFKSPHFICPLFPFKLHDFSAHPKALEFDRYCRGDNKILKLERLDYIKSMI
jgi:hypothetical protein